MAKKTTRARKNFLAANYVLKLMGEDALVLEDLQESPSFNVSQKQKKHNYKRDVSKSGDCSDFKSPNSYFCAKK